MEVRLLGPVSIVDGAGRPIAVCGVKQRTVLAMLALHADRVVAIERLVDVVWAERPPRTARRQVLNCVSTLRRVLGPGIVTTPSGYLLDTGRVAVDLLAFQSEVARARAASDRAATGDAVLALEAALTIWRGSALGGTSGLGADAARLEDTRLCALEERAELRLAAGDSGLVAELTALVDEHPHREGLVGALMLALCRSGRRADALEVYARAVTTLADHLGIEPGQQLRRRHLAILRADPAIDGPAPAEGEDWRVLVRPAQLPATSRLFVGRAEALGTLDALLPDGDEDQTPAVVISVIAGTAGIGKTALALHWAHRVADRFPDGQLYANLRGFDPGETPVRPAEAVRGFLNALQIPTARIPPDPPAQFSLYRSLLAGRRMLVVLDNARDSEQVQPLLPGSPGCFVLITSRNELTAVLVADGAHLIRLDLLSVDSARCLLARRLGATRVDAEPRAVDEIVDACARLPLALAIVAARAAAHPHFPLTALARELRDAGGALDPFDRGDTAIDIRAAFACSYRALTSDAATLFRLFGLCPGPEIGVAAAASLSGVPRCRVRSPLTELVCANLVTERAPGRYLTHDLLRAFAEEQARRLDPEPERHAALGRLLDHYLHTAYAADRRLFPIRDTITLVPPHPGVTTVSLPDHRTALAWFTAEHPVLLNAVHRAAATGFPAHAWQLAWTLADYLDWRGHWHDWADVQQVAIAAADRLADPTAQAISHRLLARARIRLGQVDDASVQLRRAIHLYREADDLVGQAHSCIDLGVMSSRQGRYAEAIEHAERAFDLHRAAGHRPGQAYALNNIGWYHAKLGDYDTALDLCRRALRLYHELGIRVGQALTWDSLGYIEQHVGRHPDAVACYERALDLIRDSGDRHNEAQVFRHLGDAHHAADEPASARAAWESALSIFEEIDHPDSDQIRSKLSRGTD